MEGTPSNDLCCIAAAPKVCENWWDSSQKSDRPKSVMQQVCPECQKASLETYGSRGQTCSGLTDSEALQRAVSCESLSKSMNHGMIAKSVQVDDDSRITSKLDCMPHFSQNYVVVSCGVVGILLGPVLGMRCALPGSEHVRNLQSENRSF